MVSGTAHRYRKVEEVATRRFRRPMSPLPVYWDTSMDTPVPIPKKMHRKTSTGCALVPTAARDTELQKLPMTRVSTVL